VGDGHGEGEGRCAGRTGSAAQYFMCCVCSAEEMRRGGASVCVCVCVCVCLTL
jgi:hypothetical protein